MKYYYCEICGNLIQMLEDSGNIPVCCDKTMTPMTEEEVNRIRKIPADECKCECN